MIPFAGRDYTGYQIIILIAIVALPIIIVVAAVWGWNHFIPKVKSVFLTPIIKYCSSR